MQTRTLMRLRASLAGLAAALVLAPAQAADASADDWSTFSRFLSILQVVMQAAAKEDPAQSERAVEDILAGRNAEANELAKELFSEVPPAERDKMISLGRSLLELQQKQAIAERRSAGDVGAIRARKDLAGMGLTYYDKQQFLDAVRRGDLIAVRLFLAGRGVDPNTADGWGTSALELAKRGGNAEMVALLEGAVKK